MTRGRSSGVRMSSGVWIDEESKLEVRGPGGSVRDEIFFNA